MPHSSSSSSRPNHIRSARWLLSSRSDPSKSEFRNRHGAASLLSIATRVCAQNITSIEPSVLQECVPRRLGKQIQLAARKGGWESLAAWMTLQKAYPAVRCTGSDASHISKEEDEEGRLRKNTRLKEWEQKERDEDASLRQHKMTLSRTKDMDLGAILRHVSVDPLHVVTLLAVCGESVPLGVLVGGLSKMPNLAVLVLVHAVVPERITHGEDRQVDEGVRRIDRRVVRAWEQKVLEEDGFANLQVLLMSGHEDGGEIVKILETFPKLGMVGMGPSPGQSYGATMDGRKVVGREFRSMPKRPQCLKDAETESFRRRRSMHEVLRDLLDYDSDEKSCSTKFRGELGRYDDDEIPALSIQFGNRPIERWGWTGFWDWYDRARPGPLPQKGDPLNNIDNHAVGSSSGTVHCAPTRDSDNEPASKKPKLRSGRGVGVHDILSGF